MAFGDALRSTGGDAATVRLTADTGEFNAKVEAAERQWRESTGAMSREALKLDLAQDRLKKSLASYGAESAQAKRATIALKDAEEQAARAADRQTRETRELTAAQSRQSAGLAGMRRSVIGLAGAYVGAYGLVSGIRSAINAAKEEETVRGQTRVALAALGIEYDRYAQRIDTVIRAQSKLGFDDEALIRTFQTFVTSTHDVNEALELNALATDVARGRYIDLEQAAQIVNKANLGMSGALRRIGIDVDKNATRVELLELLTRRYGRAAEEASDDAVAATDRLGVEWENLQEIVGGQLLPTVTRLSDWLSDYLGDAENQRRLQERVNSAVETGEAIVRGFAGAIKTLRDILKPVVDLLGGTEEAVKLLFIAMAIGKITRIVGAFVGLRGAIRLLGPTAVTSAAITNTATASIGSTALLQIPKIAALRAALAGLSLGAVGVAAAGAGAVAGGAVLGAIGIKTLSELDERLFKPSDTEQANRLADAAERQGAGWLKTAWSNIKSTTLKQALVKELRSRNRWDLLAAIGITRPASDIAVAPGEGRLGGPSPTQPAPTREPPPRTRPRRTEQDIELDIARARARTPGDTSDDVRYLRELRALYRRQIAALEARKNLTAEQKARLQQLYGQLAGAQAELDAIREENERRLDAAQDARDDRRRRRRQAAARRREARERREEREEAELARKRRERLRRQSLAGVGPLRGVAGPSTGRARPGDPSSGGASTSGSGLTEADFRRLSFEFLSGLNGVVGQFGSNITPDGTGALGMPAETRTHIWEQVNLQREQTRILQDMSGAIRSPATRYARTELTAQAWGVGF